MIKIFGKAMAGITLVLAIISCLNIETAKAQPGGTVTLQTFYDELEPYGQWVNDPAYGYVWIPDAGPEFKPYATNGHWAATEYGNTWVSDYDWGWAAFHYGRWRFADNFGWEWIPGTEWGPAWVNWRTGGDYYGWAPLGPGINIDVSFGARYYEPDNYWIFAPRRYVYEPNIYRYYVPASNNVTIIRNTTIINNVYSNNDRRYIYGPRPDDVRRYTNAPVNVYNINNNNRPGATRIRNNTINIYRPQVLANENDNYRPTRIIDRGNIDDSRNRFNNNDGKNRDNTNRNHAFDNSRQSINQGNTTVQGSNPGNADHGFGRRGTDNRNPANGINGNQFPQPSRSNPNFNNNAGNVQGTPNGTNVNGNNPVNTGGRPARDNQPVPNPNGQPGNDWRQSRGFDLNRNRTPADNQQIQQNQAQQQIQQRQQQMQQNQALQQQRSQQQQIQMQQNQRQQQMQQRQQQMQQNQDQQRSQQQQREQRSVRQDVQERKP